jgi:hypothetical protein
VGKTSKGGLLIEAYEEILQQELFRNFSQNLAFPQAQYGPAVSALLAVVVRPSVQPAVDCKYGQK